MSQLISQLGKMTTSQVKQRRNSLTISPPQSPEMEQKLSKRDLGKNFRFSFYDNEENPSGNEDESDEEFDSGSDNYVTESDGEVEPTADDNDVTGVKNQNVQFATNDNAYTDEGEDDVTYDWEYSRGKKPIMNQKSLADKAPGAQQHSFIHRTIPLPNKVPFRILQFTVICIIAILSAGIPFGFPALRQILISLEVYSELCGDKVVESKRYGCKAQEARLAVLQIGGWITWMISGWLAARAVQTLGPRTTGIIGTVQIFFGSLALALSIPYDREFLFEWMQYYILPVIVMSSGSVFVFLSCLHYVRLFPKRTSLLHAVIFLMQDLSALLFYCFYEASYRFNLRLLLLFYCVLMIVQVILFRYLFTGENIPTLRFTVTNWHHRPLMVEQPLRNHISSPFFYLGLLMMFVVFIRIFFYMSTFQIQLRLLLKPRNAAHFINPFDFSYASNEGSFNADSGSVKQQKSILATYGPDYIPFLFDQPSAASSNTIGLREFIYNPNQPEIFLTDLQEMLFILFPIASLVTIFWMRNAISDWKLSSSLGFAIVCLLIWGIVQYKNISDHDSFDNCWFAGTNIRYPLNLSRPWYSLPSNPSSSL